MTIDTSLLKAYVIVLYFNTIQLQVSNMFRTWAVYTEYCYTTKQMIVSLMSHET